MTSTNKNILPILVWDQAYNRNGNGQLPRAAVNVVRTYMDNNTLRGWIKYTTIAEATGLSLATVKRQIRQNVEAGWIRIVESGHSGGRANTYELTFPPNGVISDTITPTSEERVSPVTPEWCHVRHPNGVMDEPPTMKSTTKLTSNITTEEKGVIDDTLYSEAAAVEAAAATADESAGDHIVNATEQSEGPTRESNGVIHDTLYPFGDEPVFEPVQPRRHADPFKSPFGDMDDEPDF